MYQDLRGYGWPDVARALSVERRLIARFQEAGDLEARACGSMMSASIASSPLIASGASTWVWLQQRLRCPRSAPYLSEAATQAASQDSIKAPIPYVAFFVGEAAPDLIVSMARTARVGLRSDGTGLAQLLGAGDLDVLHFGETSLRFCDPHEPSRFSLLD
jgi:hypothetical protein